MRITKEKFADLIREYKLPMYRLSYGILQNEMDAEDAVGEAVIKAYEHLDSLREIDMFRQWIMMITANEAKHIFRKRKRVELTEDVSRYGMSQNDKHDELWDIILTLDEKYRSVIILFYYDQMKIKEISEILHITEGTVKSRMSRAKDILKKQLV